MISVKRCNKLATISKAKIWKNNIISKMTSLLPCVNEGMRALSRVAAKALKFLSKAIAGAIMFQVVLALVPDFSQNFPVIAGSCDGFLQFIEFLFKYAFKFILDGNIDGMADEWQYLLQELANWAQKFL